MALIPERQSARVSEIKYGRLGLSGAEHSKCDRMMTLGFKGLHRSTRNVISTITGHDSAECDTSTLTTTTSVIVNLSRESPPANVNKLPLATCMERKRDKPSGRNILKRTPLSIIAKWQLSQQVC